MSVRATISDSKSDFHKEFPYVIPPIYRKLVDELLVELHLLSHQKDFNKSPIFASGLKEIFTKFTSGYKPTDHIDKLFNAICNCNGFSPEEINTLSKKLIEKANTLEKENLNDYLLKENNKENENRYYSRINAIGIYKLVTDLQYHKNLTDEELNLEMTKISEILGYQKDRVEKDISLYKSNIEKMKQALEIIALNMNTK